MTQLTQNIINGITGLFKSGAKAYNLTAYAITEYRKTLKGEKAKAIDELREIIGECDKALKPLRDETRKAEGKSSDGLGGLTQYGMAFIPYTDPKAAKAAAKKEQEAQAKLLADAQAAGIDIAAIIAAKGKTTAKTTAKK